MRPIKYLILLGFMVTAALPAGLAQRNRDRDCGYNQDRRADRIDRITRNLSEEAQHVWSMVRDRRGNRSDEQQDLYVALRNFAQNARNFARDVNDSNVQSYREGASQIITEAENISDLVDRTQMSLHLRDDWNKVERQVLRLSRVYNLPYSRGRDLARTDPYYRNDPYYGDDRHGRNDGWYGGNNGSYGNGVFRWRGRVDGSDIIYLRGNRVDIRHLQAQPITGASYDLQQPLPRANVNLQLRQLQGRARVQLVQQPSPANNYTAGVLIEDNDAGADYYEFELSW